MTDVHFAPGCPRSPDLVAGTLGIAFVSIRLTAEKRRDVELIFLDGIMHRRLSAQGVQALGRRPFGIVGNRLLSPRIERPLGTRWRPIEAWRGLTDHRTGFRRRLGLLVLAAKTHGGEALQQRHPPFLRVVGIADRSPFCPDLVLRGDRQLIKPRHPLCAHGDALGLRRDEGLGRGFLRTRFTAGRFQEQ